MATIHIPSHTNPQVTIQIKSSKRLGSEKIPSNEEAAALVQEWAANMNRCLSEPELKCLAHYLRSNRKAQLDDFDKVLFGWHRRGEDEAKNVADAIQGLVNSNQESSEKMLPGFENIQTKIVSLVEKAMEKVSPPSSAATSVAAAANPTQKVNPPKKVSDHMKGNPSQCQPKKRLRSPGPSEFGYYQLSFCLKLLERREGRKKTYEESMQIKDTFEGLVAVQNRKNTGQTQECFSKEVMCGKRTLEFFLRVFNMSIEDFIPFTPKGKTTQVIRNFVENLSQTDWMSLANSGGRERVTAILSVCLSYFNKGK